jgi:hypothetical protein
MTQAKVKPAASHPQNLLRPLRQRVWLAWACGLSSVGLLLVQTLLWVIHPWWPVFVVLLAGTFVAGAGALLRGLVRVLRGPWRRRSAGLMILALLPALFWVFLGVRAHLRWQQRNIGRDWPFLLTFRAAQCLMEAQATVSYPHRRESERLVMYFDNRITDPGGDIDAMDRHVSRMEELLGARLDAKIHWVRGSLLGQRNLCCLGIALGSDQSPADGLDRHELAHAVMGQRENSSLDPPTLLEEGWAVAQAASRFELTTQALSFREFIERWGAVPKSKRDAHLKNVVDPEGFERLFRAFQTADTFSYVEALTDEYWYHRDKGPVYVLGGAVVDYLIRKHGASAYLEFHLGCTPETVRTQCRRIFGVSVQEMEEGFWREMSAAGPARKQPSPALPAK